MDFELVSEYPVTARKLFSLLRTPAFQEALALRFGALEVTVGEVVRNRDILRMRIDQVDPGRVHDGKRERFVAEYEWNLDRLENRWKRVYPDYGKKVEIEGRLSAMILGKEACRLVESFSVTIKTPLVGKCAEKNIYENLQEIQPQRVDFIMKRLGITE